MKENQVSKELNNAVRKAMGVPVEDNSPQYIGTPTEPPKRKGNGMRVTIRGNTGWLNKYEVVTTNGYPHRINASITTSDGVEICYYGLYMDEIEFVN